MRRMGNRAVLGAAVPRGVSAVVLGVWGCRAYESPGREIMEDWMRVLVGKE
jgi:hypothetical protein